MNDRVIDTDRITTPTSLPKWETPAGPVWIESHQGRQLRVRRLPGGPGLLKLGALLRHAAGSNHPRLQAPSHWWREGKDTFVAQFSPPGLPLSEERPPRPTWSEAVEAFTPLAVALKEAHRRGMVHGMLAPWNLFLEPATLRITAVDFGTWPEEPALSGPFCPPEMERPQSERHPLPATDIHNLARLLIAVALSEDEALKARPNFETIPAFAISTLERAIDPDPARRPQTIDEFLAGLSFLAPRPSSAVSANIRNDAATLFGRVRQVEHFENPRRGKGLRFHFDFGDRQQSAGFFVYREQSPELFASLQHIWEGAELNLTNPQRIEDSQGRTFLTAGAETLPVVEPHWPVSVSDVLKAQGCPQRVMVDMRDPGEHSHHLAFGNLVHGFLEDLTNDETITFEESLAGRLPGLQLDFLAAGVDDQKLQELLNDAGEHFENLRRFTARRTAEAGGQDRVGWCGDLVEATRFSTRYGLEGRTDLVVTDQAQGLQIIELKSGKPWHDHNGQVQSYALLWEELAQRESMATSGYLLYSRTGRMAQVRLDEDGGRPPLMYGRNGLVAHYHSLVDQESQFRAPFYMEEPTLCRQNDCRFRRGRCRAQTALLGLDQKATSSTAWDGFDAELIRRATSYYAHLARLVEMERWSDHCTLGAIFQPTRLAERLADGAAAADLSLEAHPRRRDRALLKGRGLHIFSPGDRLLLHKGEIDTSHLFRATVLERPESKEEATLEVALSSGQFSPQMAGTGWTADVLPARVGFRTAHRAIYRVLENRQPDVLEALLRPESVRGDQEDLSEQLAGEVRLDRATAKVLNDSQKLALIDGLRPRAATLIQGPPGTGKTTVIAHLCLELGARNQRVLLSALTNTAVDTMLIKVLDAARVRGQAPPFFLRLGSAERSPLLADALIERGLHPADYFSDDVAAEASSMEALANRLKQTQIIATTAHSALRHSAMLYFEREFDRPAFDVALIDEASQLTEPMALAPISQARRFVLVGDHRQLPPIVTSERALSAFLTVPDALKEARLAGLDQSLFERLAGFLSPRMLTTQYRMHERIMKYPAETFYEGRLVADDSVANHRLDLKGDATMPHLKAEEPVVFVDVDGLEEGRTNPEEARAVLESAARILGDCPDATLGIISPFRAQVHLLRQLLPQFGIARGVDIDTVERFQGNERDAILVSLVKTERPGDFLADARRLNVTLTRAKKKLILFGRRECLEQDPTFRQWLQSSETIVVPWTMAS